MADLLSLHFDTCAGALLHTGSNLAVHLGVTVCLSVSVEQYVSQTVPYRLIAEVQSWLSFLWQFSVDKNFENAFISKSRACLRLPISNSRVICFVSSITYKSNFSL